MRIVVNGQQPFGAEVFRRLLDHGHDIPAVYCAPDRPGAGADPLRSAAEQAGVPVRQPPSYKDPHVAEELAALEPDLMVMAFVTLFVPAAVLETPRFSSIQYHPSLLPRHRGPSAINWAIIDRDETTGATIFWPDEGLDTGPVLLTREVEIGPDDTVGSLYFDKLFPVGVQALLEGVDLVAAGRAPRIDQDESLATYESWCRREDVEVDWSRPVADVYAVIRGGDPRPGAWSTIDGVEVSLFDATLESETAGGAPGEVLEAGGDGLVVAAADGAVRVRRVRTDGAKVTASAFAHEAGVHPGATFAASSAAGDERGFVGS